MITIQQEDELFKQFDMMSEIEIQSFMERLAERLCKRDIAVNYIYPYEHKIRYNQSKPNKRRGRKAS